VLSGTTGDTSMWLNGNALFENDVSAWTPSGDASLYIGSSDAPSAFFDGEIHSFQVFPFALTQLQAEDIRLLIEKRRNKV